MYQHPLSPADTAWNVMAHVTYPEAADKRWDNLHFSDQRLLASVPYDQRALLAHQHQVTISQMLQHRPGDVVLRQRANMLAAVLGPLSSQPQKLGFAVVGTPSYGFPKPRDTRDPHAVEQRILEEQWQQALRTGRPLRPWLVDAALQNRYAPHVVESFWPGDNEWMGTEDTRGEWV